MREPPPDGTLDLPASDQVPTNGALDPGQMIGHFVIRGHLGEGGMGVVVVGEDPDLGRRVAIKLVKSEIDHPAYRARLLREAQAMARIEHPNVVRVYEVGFDRGRLFVAMELVDGVTLTTWLRVQRRSWQEVVAIFQQIGAGLAVVHRAGFVHRDFKPDNVLVDRDGRACVADFGLARFDPERAATPASPGLAASLTHTGMMLGTPGYMAPEQQLGGDVDARADQYSFCVALREALVGNRPAQEGLDWGDVPRSLRAVIARGLAYDANERFASIDELLASLGARGERRGIVGALLAVTVVAGAAIAIVIATSHDTGPAIPPVARGVATPDAAFVAPVPLDASSAGPGPVLVVANQGSATVVARSGREGSAKPPGKAGSGSNSVTLLPPPPFTNRPPPAEPRPERHEMIAAHRVVVREAIADLGYGGLTFVGNDLDADLRELRDQLAATTDELDRGMLLYGIGAAERKRGDCIGARKEWAEARKAMTTVTALPIDSEAQQTRRTQAFRHMGRSWIGTGLCELANGQARVAEQTIHGGILILFGTTEQERAEALFASGIAMWETGETKRGAELVVLASRRADATLRATITKYIQAVGLK